ncbi:MAG TPA: hypothetical protein VGL58_11580 [Caulobacteraceae bacterium]
MTTYPRWLFGVAAAVNLSVVACMLLARGLFVSLLALDPVTGTNIPLFQLSAVLIGVFGYCYVRVALDPVRQRPLIEVGVVGKTLAVITVVIGAIIWPHLLRLAILFSADLVFAALFAHYLARTRAAR